MNEKRRYIFDKTCGECFYCGEELDFATFHIDHVIPKACGGSNNRNNLVPACPKCNRIKGARNPIQFKSRMKDRVTAKLILAKSSLLDLSTFFPDPQIVEHINRDIDLAIAKVASLTFQFSSERQD